MAKCGTTLGQTDLWSDVPPYDPSSPMFPPHHPIPSVEASMAKSGTTSGQADFWSDAPPRGI